jgi:hypothetical protein
MYYVCQLFGTVLGLLWRWKKNCCTPSRCSDTRVNQPPRNSYFILFFCRNRWSNASNSYAICQARLTTACGIVVHVIWNRNRWSCPYGDDSHTPYRRQISICNYIEELVVIPMYKTTGCGSVFLYVQSVRINIHIIHVHNMSAKLHGITYKKNVFLILSAVEWKRTIHRKACSTLFSGFYILSGIMAKIFQFF